MIETLRKRFSHLNPLLVQRSVDYSRTPGELFDILDTVPAPPFVWDSSNRRWTQISIITDPKSKA